MARVSSRDEGTFSMCVSNPLGSVRRVWELTVSSSLIHEDYDDIEIYADESVISADISDQEFIDTMVNSNESFITHLRYVLLAQQA